MKNSPIVFRRAELQAWSSKESEWLKSLRPADTKWTVLNLGAGVQSSCLALMCAKGEIEPMPDFAVFADTQAEPQGVYDWLDWLEAQLPFPVYRVTNGNLTENSLKVRQHQKTGADRMPSIIPAFGILSDGTKTAAIGRACTADYKIKPILKAIKEKCGIVRAQKELTVTQMIGISWDEIQRMKDSNSKWTQHRWPLIEKKMTRRECLQWMKVNGYPQPPRSACYYCPFHSDTEWRRLRDADPEYFEKAIAFDKELRQKHKNHNKTLKMEVYLHKSCKPLEEVDFDSDTDKGQEAWDFMSECEGMCGV
jgi:3'-phosphoadenosine 5'-phosphosulfate sulfotransferase (PAPS reductase)/FAD synthetase